MCEEDMDATNCIDIYCTITVNTQKWLWDMLRLDAIQWSFQNDQSYAIVFTNGSKGWQKGSRTKTIYIVWRKPI